MKTTLKTKFPLVLILFLVIGYATSCKKDKTTTDSSGYSSIKNANWRDHIGEEFEVEGYIIDEGNGTPSITSKDKNYLFDGFYPEVEYLHLVLNRGDNLTDFHGRKVRIKGTLQANTENSIVGSAGLLGDPSLATLKVASINAVLLDSISYFTRPVRVLSFCQKYPLICSLSVNPLATKCAILYSGGINSSKAYTRYWNDLKMMYGILIANGYSAANIRVVYKDGVGNDTDIPVHYAANPTGFNDAINYMSARVNTRTQLFVMFNNHGGGYEISTSTNYGVTDNNSDEPETTNKVDENYCYYGVSDKFIDDTIAAKINRLNFGNLIVVAKPCFSGGLIWDLRGANRIIITSGTEYQVTWPHSSGNYGEMTYRFFSAVTGQTPDGTTVNADLNSDGQISMYEAYIFIKNNDARDEQPQFGNSSAGTPTTTPSSSGYGSNIFL